MEKSRKRKNLDVSHERKSIPVSLIDADSALDSWDKKALKTRTAYIMLNGAPELAVNEKENGRYRLLAGDLDFYATKYAGVKEVWAKIYRFTDNNADIFSIVERLKTEELGAMDQAYLMKRLTAEYSLTQDDISSLVGISRPAVANTLRLLTLDSEVVGLVESGKLSAGHARTLVRVPKDKQLAFAQEAIKREYTVREMERAVKAYLTPPEIIQKENEAKAQARGAQLKAFVERMRGVYRTKVSLIGNDKKGRIYIDYYSPEDLYRFEEFLDIIERFNGE